MSFGGPFTGQIGYAPLPLISAGADYGLADNVDVEAGWAVTSALFGVFELDGGCNWRPLLPAAWKPGIILGGKLLGATDFKADASRLWPGAGVTAVWRLHRLSYCYAGIDNWFETHTTRYDGNEQAYHWLPVIHTGIDYGNRTWQGQVEAVWYVPNIDARRHTVETVGIGPQGCLGVFAGISRSFNLARGKKGGAQ